MNSIISLLLAAVLEGIMLKRSSIVPEITTAMVADKSDELIENGKKFEINSAVIISKIYHKTPELVGKS
ncbi:hypothetical protein [Neobacillus drentensis]|uniref:hypothetical protein n=1 Tax=Neobacillus drentensis TaxID=220684 RepID=UPI0014721389|nr:hypothetical protein [Neobacillus drentensis]